MLAYSVSLCFAWMLSPFSSSDYTANLFFSFRSSIIETMVVGELLLSAFFQVLFERLASLDLINFVRGLKGGVDSELKKWENTLLIIQAVLNDAEEKQLTNEAVKIWLDNLRDLAYDAEDILDEFATEALKRKLMAEPDHDHQAGTSKAQNLIPAAVNCFSCFNPRTIEFNVSMRSQIKDITTRLEQLWKQRIDLGLQLAPVAISSTAAQPRPPSSSVPTERAVYGRDEDKTKIIEMVLSNRPCDHNFCVISIVGMAGVGKTTLAREVYNDKAVEDLKFDIKAWVCVSDDFDVLNISRALLESITSKPCDLKTLNEVQVQLKKAVNRQKFLLVLDDVWNENYSSWEILKSPFLAGARESKIIVTTRHTNVASTMGTIECYNLKHLSDEDCWSVFTNHAFTGKDISAYQNFELFRNKVIRKCGGLPLAASALGGLLLSKREDEWEDILNSNIWDLPQQSGILPVLRLSYYHLPSHLKRCFAYCALFPKDTEFSDKSLVFLWMAEGIIQQPKNNKQLEDWGKECFYDLVSRSIFQHSSNDSNTFTMHDLVHDLAQLVSGETNFRLEANEQIGRFQRARHFSYIRQVYENKHKFEVLYDVEQLRTFLPIPSRGSNDDSSYLDFVFFSNLLSKFTRLRVLSVRNYCISELPNSIGGLIHLRYLNLACTKIRILPESTSSLVNLQNLILTDCSHLLRLPSNLRNLINLRHLDIMGAILIREMPFGMRELKNLQTLSNFIVGRGEIVSGFKDLKSLKSLRGELCISGLENLTDLNDARQAALYEKQNLEVLSLEWGSQFDNSRDEAVEENVLDVLYPHKNIKGLTIRYYRGARFPVWIEDGSFSKIEVLTLENCENCKSLPSLGFLGSLKQLTIRGMTTLKFINSTFYGKSCLKPFQSLETLHFANLQEWECWDANVKENEHVEIFSRLRKLSIVGCPKLYGKLPELLPSLETLVVRNCAELVVSFSSYPMLNKLKVEECKGMVCNSSSIDSKLVKCMTISNSALRMHGRKGMLYNSPTTLSKTVTISNILEFNNFLKQGLQIIDTLGIGDSEQTKSWRQEQKQGLHLFSYPEEICIEKNCLILVSFPKINFLPKNLRSFFIGNNSVLKSLPEEMMGNNSQLEKFYVTNCISLTFIARCNLPSSLEWLEIVDCLNLQCLVDDVNDASSSSLVTLKHIKISNCPKLESLPDGMHTFYCLQEISIWNCPSLVRFPERGLPGAISSVSIENCAKLESLPDGMHALNCLKDISIRSCPSLVCFPEMGLPSTISAVSICHCKNLKALPDNMHKLNSLTGLIIIDCPSIVSFPEEGFPNSITSLQVLDFKLYNALIQWGLRRFTSSTFPGLIITQIPFQTRS